MKTGEKIKKIRLENNMTQDEFAEKLHVTRVAVSKWELSKSYPSIENLKTICSLFNVSSNDLLEESEKENEILSEDKFEHSSEVKKMSSRKILDISALSVISVVAVAAITLTTIGLVKTFVKENPVQPELSPIESIYVSEKPARMTYLVGQSFNSDGMVVTAVREDATEEPVEGWTVDVPDTFEEQTKNGTYDVKWVDSETDKEFVTTVDGVNVYSTMKGVFSPNGLKAIKGPLPQKSGTKFNSTGLVFHVTYDVNGETIEDDSNNYKVGDYTSNNSYDQIKLVSNPNLTSAMESISIQYSQGKTANIAIDVYKEIKANYKKAAFDASKDSFSINDIELIGVKDDGTEVSMDPSIYTWSDDTEGEVSEGHKYIYNGSHILTPTVAGSFVIEFEINVTGGASIGDVDPNLNEDQYFSEAENLDIEGDIGTLVQTGDDYTKDFKAVNCSYADFRAASYLGYTGKYEASGKGFVLGFDTSGDGRNMSMTFSAPGGGFADLIVRGASNISTGTYTSADLKVTKAATIYLNNVDITASLNQDAIFEGVKDSTPDAQNRTGEVDGMSTEGRYRFLNWTEVNLGKINLKRGSNKITFYPANGNESGHWDYVKVNVAPYKDGGAHAGEIALNKTSLTLNIDESETLIVTKSNSDSVTWSSSASDIASVDQDGKVTGLKEGSAVIQAKCGDKVATCTVTVEIDRPDLNEDKYVFECENMTLKDCAAIKQTGDNYKTDYVDNCTYAKMHANAYLGYTGDYEASGKGFVHNFDKKDANNILGTMTQTFTLPSGGNCDLTIRVSSNSGVTGSKFKTNALKANQIAIYTLNGENITSKFSDDQVTKNITTDTPDPQNRNETVDGIDINGRYRFVYWTEITIKGVKMEKGENTLVITANNNNESGHWDCVSLNFAPYKTK